MASQIWTVAQAKAELAEILRRARTEGPQRIGKKNPCLVFSVQEWERLKQQTPPLGNWLLDHMAGLGDIGLPSRADPPRTAPFAGDV